ncbi:MAG: TIGR00270 family protein [Euryarchaeota archaeon]|nr:TIGR00270 family protein [Euryarchaeota archaeon]
MTLECEICGSTAGPLRRSRVEGVAMMLCPKCANLGIPLGEPMPVGPGPRRPPARLDIIELREEWPQTLRRAREARGLTLEALARSLQEREGLLRKVERGELVPEEPLRLKLERALGVRLTEGGE